LFLSDGRAEIDNNLVENAIRPSAIGKKNWLFISDVKAGERSAVFYTLIANCHREGLNASEYLTELFERLPKATNHTVHELTPKAWAAQKGEAKKAQATTLTTLTAAGV
jgi:transposase